MKTAEHHEIHLREFISLEKVVAITTGISEISEMHCSAYMVINERDMIAMRDKLKPHRGEVYIEKQQRNVRVPKIA